MGIEQIQSAKTKALLPAFQFNWSQMESDGRAPQPWPLSGLWQAASLLDVWIGRSRRHDDCVRGSTRRIHHR